MTKVEGLINTAIQDLCVPVTCHWLSHKANVTFSEASKLLNDYAQSRKSELACIYTVSGRKGGNSTISLVSSNQLEELKKSLDSIESVQIYSVQMGIPKDSAQLWSNDFIDIYKPLFNQMIRSNGVWDNKKSTITTVVNYRPMPSPTAEALGRKGKNVTPAQQSGTTAPVRKADTFPAPAARSPPAKSSPENLEKDSKPQLLSNMSKTIKKEGNIAGFFQSRPNKMQKVAVKIEDVEMEKTNKVRRMRRRISSDSDFDESDTPAPPAEAPAKTSAPAPVVTPTSPTTAVSPVQAEPEAPKLNSPPTKKSDEVVDTNLVTKEIIDRKGSRILVSKTYINNKGYMVTEDVWETDPNADTTLPQTDSRPDAFASLGDGNGTKKRKSVKKSKEEEEDKPKRVKKATNIMSFFGRK